MEEEWNCGIKDAEKWRELWIWYEIMRNWGFFPFFYIFRISQKILNFKSENNVFRNFLLGIYLIFGYFWKNIIFFSESSMSGTYSSLIRYHLLQLEKNWQFPRNASPRYKRMDISQNQTTMKPPRVLSSLHFLYSWPSTIPSNGSS